MDVLTGAVVTPAAVPPVFRHVNSTSVEDRPIRRTATTSMSSRPAGEPGRVVNPLEFLRPAAASSGERSLMVCPHADVQTSTTATNTSKRGDAGCMDVD